MNQDKDAIPRIISVVSRMSQLIDSFQDAASTPLTIEGIVQMITDGTITKLTDIVQVLQITRDFPALINDLHGTIPSITEFAVSLTQRAQVITQALPTILSDTWTQQTANTTDLIRQNILSIQAKFREQIAPTTSDIQTRVAAIRGLISTLQFNNGVPSTEIKVASYQRWSPVSMNMPCSR